MGGKRERERKRLQAMDSSGVHEDYGQGTFLYSTHTFFSSLLPSYHELIILSLKEIKRLALSDCCSGSSLPISSFGRWDLWFLTLESCKFIPITRYTNSLV